MAEETFKDRLRRLRERKGLTRQQLHEKSGVVLSLIGHYETGAVANPGTDKVKALAKVLGVTPATLLFGRAERLETEEAGDIPRSPADTQPIDFRPGDTHEDLEPPFGDSEPTNPEAGNAA